MNYQLPILIGMLGFVYTNILTEPNQIFNGWYKKLYKFFKTDERRAQGKGVHWFFMVIMYCEKCFSGQIALWAFLYLNFNQYFYAFDLMIVLYHLFTIALAILASATIKELFNLIKNTNNKIES